MTLYELTEFTASLEVDVMKLQVIKEDGTLLDPNEIDEKGANLMKAARQKGLDGNGIERSPEDAQHRLNVSKLNKQLSPVLTTIAAIQRKEDVPGSEIAAVDRTYLIKLLSKYKAAEERFGQQDLAYKQSREQRYQEAISSTFTPMLQERGFSPAEAQVASNALTKTFLEVERNAPNSVHHAEESARQLSETYRKSAFDLSSFKPDATKIENIVCKSFDAKMTEELDGEMKIKGSAPGFRVDYAETCSAEAAELAGLKQDPMRQLHEQFEQRSVYHVGGTLTAHQAAGAGQQAQASETFRVTSSTAMNNQGEDTAFAKRMIGARTAGLEMSKADEGTLMMSRMKDSEQIGTVAPLFGTTDVVNQVDNLKPDGKIAVLGGQVESLPVRSVASSAVNEALGMKSVAKEAFGIDMNGQSVGLSVVVPGAPMLKRPDAGNSKEAFLKVDYSDSLIQKGLYDLEAQDYITGQIDRHPGNIFIDPHTREVVGIDNDLAFPTIDRDQMILSDGGLSGKAIAGMPTFMHSDTADRIEAMKPEVLRETLEGVRDPQTGITMEAAAIDGAVQRLDNLQQEIKTMRLENRVVDEFTPDHYNQARQRQIEMTNGENLGDQGSYASIRTSYVGSAVLLEARTNELNNKDSPVYKPYNERAITDPKAVPVARVNESHAAYRNGVDAAKQDLGANLEKVSDVALAAKIDQTLKKIEVLELRLGGETRDMMDTAALANVPTPRRGAVDAFKASQETRQGTLQELASARRTLDSHLNQAVEPLKPGIYRQTGLEVLTRQCEKAREEIEVAQAKLAPEIAPSANRVGDGWGVKPSSDVDQRGLIGDARHGANEQALIAAQAKLAAVEEQLENFAELTAEPMTNGRAMGRTRSDSSPAALSQQEEPATRQNTIGSLLGGHREAANQPAGPRTARTNSAG